jgi:hypothetical protein
MLHQYARLMLFHVRTLASESKAGDLFYSTTAHIEKIEDTNNCVVRIDTINSEDKVFHSYRSKEEIREIIECLPATFEMAL